LKRSISLNVIVLPEVEYKRQLDLVLKQKSLTAFEFYSFFEKLAMSKETTYSAIIEHLSKAITLSHDKRLTGYLAEYLVANELDKLGFSATVQSGRKGVDIFVYEPNPEEEAKATKTGYCIVNASTVEVKSSHIDMEFDCAASFGLGRSIDNSEFRSCVFVVFENMQPIEYLVFTIEELIEVTTKKRGTYPNNPYILLRYKTLSEYERSVPPEERLDIEIDLHKNPEKYLNQWQKVIEKNL
jgi:hypothetical protein